MEGLRVKNGIKIRTSLANPHTDHVSRSDASIWCSSDCLGFSVFRDALMGNQSTHHFHFTQAGFNIQVLLQNKQRQEDSESPSSVPMPLRAACLLQGFLVKRLVLCLHVPQQQQSLPPAGARVADGAACAETKAHVSSEATRGVQD